MRVYLTERKQQQQQLHQQQQNQQQQQQSVKRQQLYRVQSARLVLSVLFGFGNDDDSFLMVMIDKGAGTHQYKHIIITHTTAVRHVYNCAHRNRKSVRENFD